MPISAETFKDAMSQFATGVTIVTTRAGGVVHGLTANAVTSVSLDPMLVLVCIAKDLRSHAMIEDSGVFAVNILNLGQRPLAERFAGLIPDVEDRFEGIAYETAETGSPILHDVLAWLDCRIWASYDGGDHTIFVGEVVDGDTPRTDLEPLLYCRRNWSHLGTADGVTAEPWPEEKAP